MLKSILVVSGPTACGKTSTSLSLAESFNGEIVNADSVQLYKDFDIGSAKPTSAEFSRAAHHLFSVWNPREQCSAGIYQRLADPVIDEIASRGKLPIVVGGSGLFVRALLSGLVTVDEESGSALAARSQVKDKEHEIRESGASEEFVRARLHSWLAEIDADRAVALHPNDIVRVRRALVIKLSSGVGLHERFEGHHIKPRYRALIVVLNPAREALYRAIDKRVGAMFQAGLVDEVRELADKYGPDAPPFQALGYRQVLLYNNGTFGGSIHDIETLVQRDTRRFAKRQLTWWRHQPQRLRWKEVKPTSPVVASSSNVEDDGKSATSAVIGELVGSFLSKSGQFESDDVFVAKVDV